MPAQPGNSILLAYGPQGAQQAGGSIVLVYGAQAPRRRLSLSVGAAWNASATLRKTLHAPHDAAITLDHADGAAWKAGRPQDTGNVVPWGNAKAVDVASEAPWARIGPPLQPVSQGLWGAARPRDRAAAAPWGRWTLRASLATHHPWGRSVRRDQSRQAPWAPPGASLQLVLAARHGRAIPLDQVDQAPWTVYSRPLAPGWGIVIPPNPLPEPGETIIVPVRGVYIVQNEVLLTRVAGGATIPALRMSLAGDVDSWTWSFTASVPGQYLSLLEPVDGEAVELEAMVNGRQFRVLAERLSRDRVFGSSALSVSGRGKAALLSSPFAPTMSFTSAEDRTAQQIANEVLTPGGVPLGWTVDWSLTDWPVPGGVWSHQGSFMDALVRLAEAAGGYIRPDPLLQSLTFLHRYPTMPDTWGGATPDFELPSEVTTREGIEWQDLAAYDAVYVSGQQGGVLGYVKKMGSAGATFAQMITDPLITHADAARQRGRAILGNTGRKAIVTLSLPVLEETGVIEVGKMVEYVDGGTSRIGLVRSSSVDVTFPNVIQTIGVETHVS